MATEQTSTTTTSTAAPARRVFSYNGNSWDSFDPALSVAQVKDLLAQIYPELNNARTREERTGEGDNLTLTVTFDKVTGTKGFYGRPPTRREDPGAAALGAALCAAPPLVLATYAFVARIATATVEEQILLGGEWARITAHDDRECCAAEDLVKRVAAL